MLNALKSNYGLYLIEAWALGMFMLSATLFAGLIGRPDLPIRQLVDEPIARRCLMGIAMGLTAISLIYSRWGKQSGAHMNPAVTLSFLLLKKIRFHDAAWYILAQCTGGAVAMLLFRWIFPEFAGAPEVNYVQTLPGKAGPLPAFLAELTISFILLLSVLYSSNHPRTAPYTGLLAGALLMFYIIIEDPLSGVSMNPARSLASAVAAGNFMYFWIYLMAPVAGMLGAAVLWKTWICQRPDFRCSYHG